MQSKALWFTTTAPLQRIGRRALLWLALALFAVISGFTAATFPPAFSIALGSLLGAGVLLASALIVNSKSTAPTGLMRNMLCLLLFIWVVWPSYIAYKAGPLPGFSPTRLLYWALIAFWGYWIIASRDLKQKLASALRRKGLFMLVFLAYPIWQIICSLTGEATFTSLYFAVKASAGGLLLFFVTISIVRTREHLEAALLSVVAAATVVALVGLVEGARGSNPFLSFLPSDPEQQAAMEWIIQDKSRSGAYRISSTFAHPLTLGEYLLMCVPIAIGLVMTARSKLRRGLAMAYLPIAALAIYATHTRSAIVGGCILLVVFCAVIGIRAIAKKANFKGAVAGALLLFSIALASIAAGAFAISLAEGRNRDEQGSTNARIYQLAVGKAAVIESPLFGYGPGMAAAKIGFMPGVKSLTIDNHYLSVALDTGLPGLLLYCCIMLFPIAAGIQLGLSGSGQVELLALATSVALLAFSFEKIVLSLTHNFDFAFILIAITFVLQNIHGAAPSSTGEKT